MRLNSSGVVGQRGDPKIAVAASGCVNDTTCLRGCNQEEVDIVTLLRNADYGVVEGAENVRRKIEEIGRSEL